MRANTPADFWNYVIEGPGCWEWSASKTAKGYGQFSFRGKNKRAHKFAYEALNGPVAAGVVICHRCDNPSCVRPSHLYAGTSTDNNRDTVNRGRARRWNALKTHCKRGHPLSGENMYLNAASGSRVCRACMRAYRKAEASRERAGKTNRDGLQPSPVSGPASREP